MIDTDNYSNLILRLLDAHARDINADTLAGEAARAIKSLRAELAAEREKVAAAIAAAREQDARVCDQRGIDSTSIAREIEADWCAADIRAQQDPDGLAALREFGMRVLEATAKRQREICMNGVFGDGTLRIDEAETIVDRILAGQ